MEPVGKECQFTVLFTFLILVPKTNKKTKNKSNRQKIWANFKENIGVEKGDFLKYDVKARNYEKADW